MHELANPLAERPEDMKIKDVRTTRLSVPLKAPIADSTHILNRIQWILVDVLTDEGLTGNSFMLTFDYGPELLQRIVDAELKPLILGKDPQHIAQIWELCHSHCEYTGQSGVAAWGIAAIEIALWDLLGKRLGAPVYRLLGAYREEIPAYGSGGWLSYSLDELLAEANSYLQRGFKMVKMKVGSPDPKRDIERVREVRRLVGENIRLMVDANQAWQPHQAIAFARQVQDENIFWLEEPVAKDDVDGYARVASSIDIPVATGEREYLLTAFRELLARGTAIVQPDALRIGGISQCLKVAHLAEAFNRLVAPHFYKEIDVHVLATVRNGLFLEYFSWLDDLLVHPLVVADGVARVPQEPGLGISFKPEAVREYLVS
jgi:L-alanine-DL-glutamate epimerase-like enolase superfamily enzyme